jgi:hypothetical protein
MTRRGVTGRPRRDGNPAERRRPAVDDVVRDVGMIRLFDGGGANPRAGARLRLGRSNRREVGPRRRE